MNSRHDEKRLAGRVLFAYSLPAILLATLALPLYIVVPTFYVSTLGLPLGAVGFVLLAIRIVDAVADPAIGWLSDRINAPAGRRRTFVLTSAVPTAFAAFMLFWPPDDAGLVYLAIWGTALSIGYTCTLLPYSAWGAELVNDYSGRLRVSAFREGATLIGTLGAIALAFATNAQALSNAGDLRVLAMFVGALLPVAACAAFLWVPEPRDRSRHRLGLADAGRFLVANRPFRRLILAFVMNGFANAVPATLFLYFVGQRLEAPQWSGPLLLAYFVSGLAGIPLALFAARFVGKHRAWCVAMTAAAVIFGGAGFLGAGDIHLFAVICVATGLLLGFDLVLPPAIQADVIDQDTATSGEQRSGLYFAAWSLATKLSLAGAVGVVFPLLGLAGFAGEGNNSAGALDVLSMLYAWLPIPAKLAAIVLMWRFPIGEAEQQALRQKIEAV
ncbi:MFS transporter [Ensifer sp.]|uniref:MFS transporter n=1 Tax=Ensifer sp. TaxID=1872086 RepID=UPI0028A15D88|nr:MFS transporter [Ensifer sp.]